jgi:phenylacetate-CoA ligase
MVHAAYFTVRGFDHLKRSRFLDKSQWWSRERIESYQNGELQKLINYAYNYVPYYRRVMDQRDIRPLDIKNTLDLTMFPILTKESFRRNWNDLISTEKMKSGYSKRYTGGSTGEPLQIFVDPDNGAWEGAAYLRGLGFSGYKNGDSLVSLFGGSLGLAPQRIYAVLKAKFAGEIFLPAFEISRHTVNQYVQTIKKSKSHFLNGYTSAIFLLAKLMKENRLHAPLKAVFPTAETLHDYQKETIEEAFRCEIFELYGCGEINSLAFECSAHCGLHVTDENVYLETLQEEHRVPDGTMGALTVTTFHNYVMPLIRYQNGDVVALERDKCSCGRGLSRIKKIFGRSNDLLMATDGRLISGAFIPHLFRTTEGISEVQVVQDSLEDLVVKIVKGPKFSESEVSRRLSVLTEYLGNVAIHLEYVDKIPRTPSGKLRSVVSNLGDGILARHSTETGA